MGHNPRIFMTAGGSGGGSNAFTIPYNVDYTNTPTSSAISFDNTDPTGVSTIYISNIDRFFVGLYQFYYELHQEILDTNPDQSLSIYLRVEDDSNTNQYYLYRLPISGITNDASGWSIVGVTIIFYP